MKVSIEFERACGVNKIRLFHDGHSTFQGSIPQNDSIIQLEDATLVRIDPTAPVAVPEPSITIKKLLKDLEGYRYAASVREWLGV